MRHTGSPTCLPARSQAAALSAARRRRPRQDTGAGGRRVPSPAPPPRRRRRARRRTPRPPPGRRGRRSPARAARAARRPRRASRRSGGWGAPLPTRSHRRARSGDDVVLEGRVRPAAMPKGTAVSRSSGATSAASVMRAPSPSMDVRAERSTALRPSSAHALASLARTPLVSRYRLRRWVIHSRCHGGSTSPASRRHGPLRRLRLAGGDRPRRRPRELLGRAGRARRPRRRVGLRQERHRRRPSSASRA